MDGHAGVLPDGRSRLSYYQFTSARAEDGFLVQLYEGNGGHRKLIGKARVPFRSWMDVPAYCPKEART